MSRVSGERCIVLHTRAYRESSLLVSLFSFNHGRVTLVAKGVRRGRRRAGDLQPFSRLVAGWAGRSSLKTLTTFDVEQHTWLKGDALAAGFYIAELLMRLLAEHESHPRLFAATCWALDNLEDDLEPVLRAFEKLLLEELGYGIDFGRDTSGAEIAAATYYRFDPDRGFSATDQPTAYLGGHLLAIGAGRINEPSTLRCAKRLFRQSLTRRLGPKPLLSRRLLQGRLLRGRPN